MSELKIGGGNASAASSNPIASTGSSATKANQPRIVGSPVGSPRRKPSSSGHNRQARRSINAGPPLAAAGRIGVQFSKGMTSRGSSRSEGRPVIGHLLTKRAEKLEDRLSLYRHRCPSGSQASARADDVDIDFARACRSRTQVMRRQRQRWTADRFGHGTPRNRHQIAAVGIAADVPSWMNLRRVPARPIVAVRHARPSPGRIRAETPCRSAHRADGIVQACLSSM